MTNRTKLRKQVLELVRQFHAAGPQKPFRPGDDPVRYAGRHYDAEELVNLVDSSLDFWLTAGRYTEEFEVTLANYLGLPSHASGQFWFLG